MKVFKKIDAETGIFLEIVLLESHPILTKIITSEIEVDGKLETIEMEVNVLDTERNPLTDPQYILNDIPQGFYLPRWNGTEWVEGGVVPDPVPPAPTEVERLVAIEEALDFLLMGGM